MMRNLNLGCGRRIYKDFENVDIQKHYLVDKSFDFEKFPYPYKDNTFDLVLIERTLSFLDNPYKVLLEVRRIAKPGAIIIIKDLYYNCRASANDISIKHRFNDQTFISMLKAEKHYKLTKEEDKFEILRNELIPTRLGKLIYPKSLRWCVGCCIGEIYNEVLVVLEVKKNG